jgi:hypothetical protein
VATATRFRHRNPIAPHDRDDTSTTPAAGRSRTVLGLRRPTQVGTAQWPVRRQHDRS